MMIIAMSFELILALALLTESWYFTHRVLVSGDPGLFSEV